MSDTKDKIDPIVTQFTAHCAAFQTAADKYDINRSPVTLLAVKTEFNLMKSMAGRATSIDNRCLSYLADAMDRMRRIQRAIRYPEPIVEPPPPPSDAEELLWRKITPLLEVLEYILAKLETPLSETLQDIYIDNGHKAVAAISLLLHNYVFENETRRSVTAGMIRAFVAQVDKIHDARVEEEDETIFEIDDEDDGWNHDEDDEDDGWNHADDDGDWIKETDDERIDDVGLSDSACNVIAWILTILLLYIFFGNYHIL